MTNSSVQDPSQWIDRETYALYLGEGSEKALAIYDKAVKNKKLLVLSLNWLALLVFPAWAAYRRQWSIFFSLLAISVAAGLLEDLLIINIPSSTFSGPMIMMGIWANSLMLMTANAKFQKLQAQGKDIETIRAELKDQAAKSVPLAFAGLFGFLAVLLLAIFIVEFFVGVPT